MDQLLEEVEILRQNTVSDSSRIIYLNSCVKYLLWLHHNKPELITEPLNSHIVTHGANHTSVKTFLKKGIHPIKFKEVKSVDFLAWIVSLRTKNGEKPGYSSYNCHRSAFFNLFRSFGETMDAKLSSDLSVHFKGLKRTTALAVANGEGSVKVGKDPLPFGLYRFLAKSFLQQSSKEFVFGQTFMVICWNLMCRSANAFSIKYSHMEFKEDALCIYFAHMKNDQCGERPRDPRHVYANPLMPEICPILSLGIYWLTFSFVNGNSSLFPGDNQYDRFRKLLQRANGLEIIKNELSRRSLDPNNLGTHSMRKGAATYCSSGSTAGPSSNSIHLRAGWAMGDTNLSYEAAGDMFLGRVVAGLPLDKPEFDVIGPTFIGNSKFVMDAVKNIFKSIPDSLIAIGEKALASLVFHSDFLVELLPNNHPVKQSILFRDRELLNSLKSIVKCGLNGENLQVVPTGIPPHTSILREMKTIVNEIKLLTPQIDYASKNVVNEVKKGLEERAIGAGNVTWDGLEQVISREFSRFLGPRADVSIQEEPDQPAAVTNQMFQWGGRLRRLPEDYSLPNGTVASAFQCWMIPDSIAGTTALRYCGTSDFDDANMKRRFGDLAKLMKSIENVAREKGIFNERPSLTQLNQMMIVWEEEIGISTVTPMGRTRRVGQLKWRTVLKILRENRQ